MKKMNDEIDYEKFKWCLTVNKSTMTVAVIKYWHNFKTMI